MLIATDMQADSVKLYPKPDIIADLPAMHSWVSSSYGKKLVEHAATREELEFILAGALHRLAEMPILSSMGYPARMS